MCRSTFSLILILSIVFLFLAGCQSSVTKVEPREYYEPNVEPLLSSELMERANLDKVWHAQIPLRKGEEIHQMILLGNRLYAFTDENYMFGLNRETGTVVLSRPLSAILNPSVSLEQRGRKLVGVLGNSISEINPDTGEEIGSYNISDCSASCPLAFNSNYYYYAGVDHRVHVLQMDPKVHLFEIASTDDARITEIAADDDIVVFGSEKGLLTAVSGGKPVKMWEFPTAGAIASPIVKKRDTVLAASEDTYLYRIDAASGNLRWKKQLPTRLDAGPKITRKIIYQILDDQGIAALDIDTGQILWTLVDGKFVLAESQKRSYILTAQKEMVVLEKTSGKLLYSVELPMIAQQAENFVDEMIYVGDEKGRVLCAKPGNRR